MDVSYKCAHLQAPLTPNNRFFIGSRRPNGQKAENKQIMEKLNVILYAFFGVVRFCFLGYGSNLQMKSYYSSFTTKPSPSVFYSCKQYLAGVVKCKALLHQLGRCVAQLLLADAVSLQSLE